MGSVLKKTYKEFEKIVNKNNVFDDIIMMPKFDGVSISLFIKFDEKGNGRLLKAYTRGQKINGIVCNTDQTEKLKYFIESYKTFNPKLLNSEISIRGEILLNSKKYDENGKNLLPNSSITSGYMNGKMDNFKDNVELLTIQCYEIGKIKRYNNEEELNEVKEKKDKELNEVKEKSEELKNYKIIIPTQINALEILKTIKIKLCYLNTFQSISDFNYDVLPINDFMKLFKNSINEYYLKCYAFNNKLISPTDGIVYTYSKWKYPTKADVFNKEGYLKYGWKPSAKYTGIIKSVNYQQGKTGEYSMIFDIEPLQIEGKNYKKLKIALSKVIDKNSLKTEEPNLRIGSGSKVCLTLSHSITLKFLNIIQSGDDLINLPEKCKWCGKKLKIDDTHIVCENYNCCEKVNQRINHLISYIQKTNKNKLIVLNDKNEQVNKGFGLKNIEKCVNGGLNPTKISIYIPNIKEEFNKLTDINKLYACSYGGINECKKKETFDKKDKMFEWLNKYVF